jgi:hypothetical protein
MATLHNRQPLTVNRRWPGRMNIAAAEVERNGTGLAGRDLMFGDDGFDRVLRHAHRAIDHPSGSMTRKLEPSLKQFIGHIPVGMEYHNRTRFFDK